MQKEIQLFVYSAIFSTFPRVIASVRFFYFVSPGFKKERKKRMIFACYYSLL